ncbi:hypothetical protein [Desulfosporosinus sp. SB140]|uniref:hypothetical protein n=1 Tax=Desulfosporosinus paludis TaxID=3115649 RepID=UPI003890DE71
MKIFSQNQERPDIKEKTISEAVNELINQIHSREASIKNKISELQAQATKEKTLISQLTRDLVTAEMAGDGKAQLDINNQLIKCKQNYDGLSDRIKGYEDALNDKGFIRLQLPGIFEVLDRGKEKLAQERQAKSKELEDILEGIKHLEEQANVLRREAQTFTYQSSSIENTVASLVKYVEPRRVERGHELDYLRLFSEGSKAEYLEAFIEKPADNRPAPIPHQTFGVVKANPFSQEIKQPSEPRNLMMSEHHRV